LRRARGLACDADQIVVVHGSQQGIDLCARVLVDPGDHVLVEEPGYAMARYAFEALGARVSGVVADAHGLVVSQLPQAGAQLVYVTPSHQFPLGGVMPVSRRQALLDWAQQAQAWVVEDDYDGEFRYGLRPVDSLQAMDAAGRVIYIGTFSKALSPQLRLGYLVLPPALVDVFRKAKRLVDRHAPLWEQRVLAQLIDAGVYERHVRRLRRANERRREALLQALGRWLPGGAEVEGAASGLHLVVWIGAVPARDEARLVQQARALGAGVSPISPLYAAGATHRAQRSAGLVLGYASLEVPEIDEGVRRLAEAVALVARSPSG
jgi:GntR family transcriptional regulator/MocR family aminotransferase